ncbi:MAG: hypothetical protein ACREPP_09830, partial [Rhodanobacteraceae bacterium]
MNPGRNLGIGVIVALLAVVGVWQWQHAHAPDAVGLPVGGGDAGGLPRADASSEGFDATPLEAATVWAGQERNGALLVSRHGHLLIEQYAGDVNVASLVNGGAMSDALVLLAAGVAVPQHGMAVPATETIDIAQLTAVIAKASGRSFPQFLSRNIWQPLNAAPARWSEQKLRARAIDWLRVAELLLHDGRFEGTQVVPSGWAMHAHLL